jgi:hypothetical protein
MRRTYKITYGSNKAVKEWCQVTEYETVERRVHFITADGKRVILCGHWMVEEE